MNVSDLVKHFAAYTSADLRPRRPVRTVEDLKRLALRRTGRDHGKRHSTNRERSYAARAKVRRGRYKQAMKAAASEKYHAAVREYWLGLRDTHPGA